MKMRTFDAHIEEKLKDKEFKELFDAEERLLRMLMKIAEARKSLGLSQKALASKAKVTQQQISKIESGINCNMATFLRVCQALGVVCELRRSSQFYESRRSSSPTSERKK